MSTAPDFRPVPTPPTVDMPIVQPDPADVAAFLAELTERITDLERQASDARRWLAEHLADGTHPLRGLKVTVYRMRRWDPKRAANALPPEWAKKCERTVIDRAVAERVLPDDLYHLCQAEGRRTVRLT